MGQVWDLIFTQDFHADFLAGVVLIDPWLSEFKDALRKRHSLAMKWMKTIKDTEGSLDQFSKGYDTYGFNVSSNGDIVYREWAPNAEQAFLIGDFSTFVLRDYILHHHKLTILSQTVGIETHIL